MTSDIPTNNEIKHALLAETIKSAAFFNKHITEQQVIAEVEQLLTQIQAPEGLRGFYYVGQTLLQLFDATDSTLQSQLEISDYIVDALRLDLQLVLSKQACYQYIKTSIGNNWANSNPLYLMLFCASGFKNAVEDVLFMDAFVVHAINNKLLLEDENIQPTKRTRTEEVCRALRILQDKRQVSFNVLLLAENIKNWRAHEIARALERFTQQVSIDKDTIRYLRTLTKFFANDWPKPKLRGKLGPQKKGRRGSGKKVSARPQKVINKTSVTPGPIQLDEQGIDEHDVEILRTHLAEEIEEESGRENYEQNSIAAIFDNQLQTLGSLDITRNLRQKNNLNTSNRLLLSAASVSLLTRMCLSRMQKAESNEAALAIYCMLSTGISLSQLVKLHIYTDGSSAENGICLLAGQYYWRFKHRVSATTPVGRPEYFHRSDLWVNTPISDVLTSYLKTHRISNETGLFKQTEQQLRKRIDKLLQRTTEKLKVPNISITMIESFLSRFTEAADTVDPVVLDFSYQQEFFSTRVSRSYVNLSYDQRLSMLQKLWSDITAYVDDDAVSECFRPPSLASAERAAIDYFRVGSRFVPTESFCQQFTQQLRADLDKKVPGPTLKQADLVAYHNAYVRYTAWMLGFGSGYRAVCNPLPTFELHVPDLQLLSISDKDDAVYSHSRIVALPDSLNLQLTYLKSHLIRLAQLLALASPKLFQQIRNVLEMEQKLEYMTNMKIEKWFKSIRNARDNIGPLFYIDDALQAQPVTPAWLKTGNGSFNSLPVNMGRHWLKTSLVTSGVATELVNFQMGHWQEGQSPLFEYSSISVIDCIAELASQIEQLMAMQGWRPCRSALL